jgi:hypothetical protein
MNYPNAPFRPFPILADRPGFWIACNQCQAVADPRYGEPPPGMGKPTTETVWRACLLRGWTGTPEESYCPSCSLRFHVPVPPEVEQFKARTPVPETFRRVIEAVEVHAASPSFEAAQEIKRAIVEHYRAGNMMDSQLCVLLGIGYALAKLYPHKLRKLWFFHAVIFLARHTIKRGSAGWNDFEMAAWMTTHEPVYVRRILHRLQTERGMVQETCEWMVASTCQQNPLFAQQWQEVTAGAGYQGRGSVKEKP